MQRRRPKSNCRIVSVEETGAGTVLEVGGEDRRRVSTPSHPDRATARKLLGCSRRTDWVVLGLDGGGGSAVLGAHVHRVPRRMPIPVPVALGLAEAGVPTFLSGVRS